jgi:hypothetical protein
MARTLARTSEDLPEWQRNREVQRLTKEILALQREAGAKVAAAVVEMGGKMRLVQAALEPGQWLVWLETAVPFTRRTITNYMRLSEWAEEQPRELQRLEHLGPTKLYMLAPLAPDRRRELTGRVPIVIPGHERPKTIDVMTVVELGRVIGGLVTRPGKRPIGKVVQGLRHRIAGIDAVADELVQRKDEVDGEQAAEVLEALRAVLEELEGAFG